MSPNGSDRSPRRPMRRKLLQAMTAGLVLATATGCSYGSSGTTGSCSRSTRPCGRRGSRRAV
ncbi:hypothetical protein ACWDRX_23690, partial [Streptomyces nigra]